MHWTEPATADDSPDCGDMSPLSRRDMSRAKSAVVPAHSGKPDLLNLRVEERVGCTFRFSHLLSLPEGANVGQAVNEAMRAIEKENPDMSDVLPKSYHILESRTLASFLKTMASIFMDKGKVLNTEARELQARISENVTKLLAA